MPNTPAPGMEKRSRFAYLGCAALIVAAILASVVFAFRQARAEEPTQRVTTTPRLRIARQTADSAFVVGTCSVSNADTARFAWTYPAYTRAVAVRPASCRDTARVRRGTVAQSLRLDVTAKMGATVGNTRFATITIPARPSAAPPTVDSVRVDTGTVAPPYVPPVAQSFWISPDVVTLRSGNTQQFGTQITWVGSGPGPHSVTWSATGGTITGNGLYTAGATAGTYRVIAWCSCLTRPDTAVITIAAGTVTPPPDTTPPVVTPPSGDFAANLPAGMRLIAESSFENYPNTADGIEVVNWANNTVESSTTFGIRPVASTGGYGARALHIWFPGNHAGDGVGPATLTVNVNSRGHCMAVRMRYMPGYVWHTNTEKLFYPVGPAGASTAHGTLLNVSHAGHLIGYASPIEASPVGEPQSPAGVVPKGSWFTALFCAEMNTPGQSNGWRQVWINGVRVVNQSGIMFSNNTTVQQLFDRGRLDFTRGGGPSSVLTPAGGQWVEVDRLAFYGR